MAIHRRWFIVLIVLALAGTVAKAAAQELVGVGSGLGTECKLSIVSATFGELRIKVADRYFVLAQDEPQLPQHVRLYPIGRDAMLFAYISRGHSRNGSSTLWKVGCKTGSPDVFLHVDGADFGHATMSQDRHTLFFSGPDGIYALDLASRAQRRLTNAEDADCRQLEYPARDVILGASPDGDLAFERGCDHGHEWHAKTMALQNAGKARMRVVSVTTPPTAVALGAGGWLWLAAARCDDQTSLARINVSTNDGRNWHTVHIGMSTPQPVRHILADQFHPGAALILTWACGSESHVDPAWIYLTEDGGNSFRAIAVPPGIPAGSKGGPASEQDPLRAVFAPDGTLSRLILYGESDQVMANRVGRWESRDGGRSWAVLPPVDRVPQQDATEAISPADSGGLTIRDGNLYRWIRRGEPGVRIDLPR